LNEKFLGFRFNTNNGFDHLLRAMATGAVADTTRTVNPLPAGSIVVVLAKVGDQYIAASGTSTGRVLDVAPQHVWPAWGVSKTLVHEVVFKTRPVFVPEELAKRPTNNISAKHAEDLAYYVFANG
jgi:hypothetical protein